MDEKFLKQIFPELTNAQEVTLRLLASAIGDVTGKPEQLAQRLEQRAATLAVDRRHPTAEKWVAAMIRELREVPPAKH
jgi:hypothetical protein